MMLTEVVFQVFQGQQGGRPNPEQRDLHVSKTVKPFQVELYFLTSYVFNEVKIFDCNLYSIHLEVNN